MTRVEPELWVGDPTMAIDFYVRAFGARVVHRVGQGNEIVAQLAVGDPRFWVSNSGGERLDPVIVGGATGRTLLVTVDPDVVVAHAVEAGAQEVSGVQDEHGWRVGTPSSTRPGTSGRSGVPSETGHRPSTRVVERAADRSASRTAHAIDPAFAGSRRRGRGGEGSTMLPSGLGALRRTAVTASPTQQRCQTTRHRSTGCESGRLHEVRYAPEPVT